MWQLIESFMHGKVLNVRDWSTAPGTPIQLWDREAGPPNSQLFMLQLYDQSRFWIRSALNSEMVLDVEAANARGGTKVILYRCSYPAIPNQLWRWEGDMIKSCLGNLVLDINREYKHNGAELIIWEPKYHSYNDNQRWRLVTL